MTQLSFATLDHRNKKKRTKREAFLAEMEAVVAAMWPGGPRELPAGCYAAWLTNSPFADDLGVESTELFGEHALLGVLPGDGQDVR